MTEGAKTEEGETRDLILDQAEALIRHIGRKKTNVEDIAQKLGMSRANIYRFYPTRAAIDRGVYRICHGSSLIHAHDPRACPRLS